MVAVVQEEEVGLDMAADIWWETAAQGDKVVVVAHPVAAVPCYLACPGRIASHSKLVALVVLAVAEVVVALRFPLYLL